MCVRSVAIIGGGPAGLYFASAFIKHRADARVTVFERAAAYVRDRGVGYTLGPETASLLSEANSDILGKHVRGLPTWQSIEISVLGQRACVRSASTLGITGTKLTEMLREDCVESGVRIIDAVEIRDSDLKMLRSEYDLVVLASGSDLSIHNDCLGEDKIEFILGDNRFHWTRVRSFAGCLSITIEEVDGIRVLLTTYPIEHETSCAIVECRESNSSYVQDKLFLARLNERLQSRGWPALEMNNSEYGWNRPLLNRSPRLQRGNTVIIGDASCSFHYSSGFGLFYALEAGRVLCAALAMVPNVETALSLYERSITDVLGRKQRKSVKRMRLFEAMASRANHTLEYLVEEYFDKGSED
jgi:anthraniloyl-CoA monooxygenase